MILDLPKNPKFAFGLLVAIFLISIEIVGQQPSVDSPARVLNAPPFELSDDVVAAGIDGEVVIVFRVDEKGHAENVMIIGGPAWPCGTKPKKEIEEVRNAVKQNVERVSFSPAIKGGKPVSTDVMLKYQIGQAYKAEKKKREAEKNGKVIQGGVINGRALRLPKPAYPPEARSVRVSGVVSIQVVIDEEGKVIRAGAINGHPLLQTEARLAACSAEFSPTLLEGQPVKVSGIITYNFVP